MVDYDVLGWSWDNWGDDDVNTVIPSPPYQESMEESMMCEAQDVVLKWAGWETTLAKLLEAGWKIQIKAKYTRTKLGKGKWIKGEYIYLSNPELGMFGRWSIMKNEPERTIFNLDFMINKKFHRQVPLRIYTEDYAEIEAEIREQLIQDMEIAAGHRDTEKLAEELKTCYTVEDIPELFATINRLQENYPKSKRKHVEITLDNIIQLFRKAA